MLSRILGVNDAPESSLLRVTRLVLCPAENGATLYLQDANQGFFVSRTEISSATLREALASLDGNGTDFAFSLSGEFSQLSPYTLIFSEPPQRYTLSASNALTDQATFLRLAEESGYTDSSGSTIIKEVYGTLRLEPDGSVFYQGADEAEAGSIYYVSAASTGKPTMLEAVAGAQRLAFTLLRDVSGDAELYLSEIDSSNKRFTVRRCAFPAAATPPRSRSKTRPSRNFPSTAAAIRSAIRPHCCCPSGRPRPSRIANI